jgi:GNAT superfamily N-acetyltransferase
MDSRSPAVRRRDLATAPPGLLPLSIRIRAMSHREGEAAFFAELERAAGEGQTFYTGPFVVVGDRKGGILGNLELSLNSALKVNGVRGVHLAFVGVSRENRSQGRGRRLVEIVLEAADAVGLPVDLDVDPQRMRGDTRPPMNKGALRAFYRSLGFVQKRGMGPDSMVRPVPVT